MTLDHHRDDPDAIPLSAADAIAYAARAEALSRESGAEPVLTRAYGPDRGQRLDIYAPAEGRDLPVLVFLHGGAWVSGHLGWLRFMAPAVLAMPAILVAATYRLAPRLRWPAQLHDARAALEAARDMASTMGGDPERIAAAGHSAGAHLAAMATLRPGPVTPRACFGVSGPYDLRYGDVPIESPAGRVYKYLLAERAHDAEASPVALAASAACPFDLTWGGSDLDRVIDSGTRFAQALEGRVPVTRTVLPGASHFDTHLALADPADPWYGRLAKAFG